MPRNLAVKVQITGYIEGKFLPISFIKFLQKTTGEEFGSAKHRVDRLAAGHRIEISFPTSAPAEAFVRDAVELGAEASIAAG